MLRLGKKVAQYDLTGRFLKMYITGKEASRSTGIHYTDIMRSCSGKRYTAGGFLWGYALSDRDLDDIGICQCCGKKTHQEGMVMISLECLQRYKYGISNEVI